MDDPIRVLHVESDPQFRALTADSLTAVSDVIDVSSHPSPDGALSAIRDRDVDCLLTDYEFEGATGLELLEDVREEWPNLPVILFTGTGSEAVASRAISAGVTDYFQKTGRQKQYALLANRVEDAVESGRRERERRRNQRQFEAIFDDPNLLVGLLDPDGTVRDVNRTAAEYVPVDREEATGRTFWETAWWPETLRDDVREWVAAAAAGEYVDYEATHPNPGGRPITAEGSFRPVTDRNGTVTAIVVSARDVTESRRRERELQRQYERLDDFASFVSHDFQTPISTARGRLELARETDADEHLDRAIDAVERIDRLRSDLAETLRSGDIVSERTDVAIEDVVGDAWEAVDPPAAASVSVRESTALRADREALQRLLENFVRNSIEHGDADVNVLVGATDDGFYYEDSGPGIDPELREDVFTPGFSTKTRSDGTGMGLAGVHQIVLAHRWDIDVCDARTLSGARFEVQTG
ncbi:PAS domain-containing protein [Halobellus rufus]|uniref:PAS domain-containing protein n=1 Tax=Halobellus rufus TaxID=1448860 RepID=UPI0012E0943C|nr:PAS domain-containing protein [Halobellus rufus]